MVVNKSLLRMFNFLTGFAVIIAGFQNCSPTQFNPATDELATCSQSLEQTQEKLRIIFMVDNSDSTKGTDPSQKYRVEVLRNFLAQYGTKTNFSYNFGYFGPSAYAWDIAHDAFLANPVQPIGTATDFTNALNAFSKPIPTQLGTNYDGAFTEIQDVIDLVAKSGDGWNYVVVFMSDGKPTGWGKSGADQANKVQAKVLALAADVNAHGSLLSISSVYFGPESDAQAINNLKVMASLGGGQFVDTNTVTSLTISDIITVPGETCVQ